MKNYHTHTYRCKHAKGEVEDYVKKAIEEGITVLGISDHTPLPDNRWQEIRMSMDELDDYEKAIEESKKKYPEIKILKAMECEYAVEYDTFYREELLGKRQFDYLIAGTHAFLCDGEWVGVYGGITTKKRLKAYAEAVVQSMKADLFTFVAHPDLFGNAYEIWDEETIACSKYILEAAEDLQTPLEINGYGLRKDRIKTEQGIRCMYPWLPFWELASAYNITVVVNSDAHFPRDVAANIKEGLEIVEKYNLQLADFSYLEYK